MTKARFVLCFIFAGIFALMGSIVSAQGMAGDVALSKELMAQSQQSTYPPAFLGSEWAYGFALFSFTIICALAFRHLIMIVGYMLEYRESWGAPITITRMIIVSLLITIISATLPDAVLLFAWGEVNFRAISILAKIDRIFDGITVIPFAFAVFLMIRGEAMLHDQLLRPPIRNDLWPTFAAVKHHVALILIVVVIALGVTVGK